MSLQILALIIVVVVFAALFTWVLLPRNRSRFEANARSILDDGEQQ